MCGPKPPKDNSAEIARQQAVEREAKINQGKQSIDNAFGVFDPQYYQKYQDAYTANYNPQVDRQFQQAKQQVQYNLARKGTTDSTIGQKNFGDLVTGYDDARRQVASDAADASNKLRQNVESQKSQLYAQNSASADPSLSAIQAVSSAGSLRTPANYSPIGDLFSGLVNTTASYMAGQNQGLPAGYRAALLTPGSTLPSGGGSGRVVR
jgi:hypothetical protein